MTFLMFRSTMPGHALQQLLKETVEVIGSAKTVRKGYIEKIFTLINDCVSKSIERCLLWDFQGLPALTFGCLYQTKVTKSNFGTLFLQEKDDDKEIG